RHLFRHPVDADFAHLVQGSQYGELGGAQPRWGKLGIVKAGHAPHRLAHGAAITVPDAEFFHAAHLHGYMPVSTPNASMLPAVNQRPRKGPPARHAAYR